MLQAFELSDVGFDPFLAGLPTCRLTARERLELLCDRGSLHPLRSGVLSRAAGPRARHGDGVVTATGCVEGRPIVCYAQDSSVLAGSLGVVHAESIARALRLALDAEVPVIGFLESAGARMQEGAAALGAYGRIFAQNVALSGRVPQISVMTGICAGGSTYSPALTDFVVMTEASSMFLTGPGVVEEVCGESVTTEQLGGPRIHARNGVSHFSVPTDIDAIFLVRHLLTYLPQHAPGPPPRVASAPAVSLDPGVHVPARSRSVYDIRDVIRDITDEGKLLELAPRWARNAVTGLARIDGWSVGILANQPRALCGVLDIHAAQKAARFVRTCNTFGLPVVVLVDTPGFMPGTKQEAAGVIRHGAELLYAFAEASVPRITVVLRKAFGGAFISMNAKDLGADLTFTWPDADIGVMGGEQAVRVLHRRELENATDMAETRRLLAEAYAREHGGVRGAIEDGVVDEVIAPEETRDRIARGLMLLSGREGRRPLAGNLPA